ncbi:DUF3050 domain-containing protein [Salegentibacter sp. F14]
MIQEINQNFNLGLKNLTNSTIHQHINTKEQLKVYMEHEIFEVWASMSLLNSLKEEFTKTTNPWLPVGDPELRFLINKVNLEEETAMNYFGEHQSKFEMYLDAMAATGAKTENITNFLRHVSHGTDIFLIIAASKLPLCIKKYIKTIFEIISEGEPHKIAAAFAYSSVVMSNFNLLNEIPKIEMDAKTDLKLLKHFLGMQTQNDFVPAFRIVEMLCRKSPRKWDDTKLIAEVIAQNQRNLMEGVKTELTGSF